MTQKEPAQQDIRCLLCTNQVKDQGDVCPGCHPQYIAMGKALIDYANQLEPILKASPHKHIGAPMRFVPDEHFFLKELDTPVPHEDKMITHCLALMTLTLDEGNPLHQGHWYGHNIPSTLMAATINPGGFPQDPSYFVPIESWKAVPRAGAKPGKAEPRDVSTKRKDDEVSHAREDQ